MKHVSSICSGKAFDEFCSSSRDFLNIPFEELDLSEDADILFDNRTEEEKRKAHNACMKELYYKLMDSDSCIEIVYPGGPLQLIKDVYVENI